MWFGLCSFGTKQADAGSLPTRLEPETMQRAAKNFRHIAIQTARIETARAHRAHLMARELHGGSSAEDHRMPAVAAPAA